MFCLSLLDLAGPYGESIMPFICLANANVPNGVLQITDLWPNVSQDNNPTNPPGQTRYLARPATDTVQTTGAGALTLRPAVELSNQPTISGLAAYIADVVDPGGSEAATGTMTLTGVLVGDIITYTGPDGVLTQAYTAVENTATGTITVEDPTAAVGRLTVGLSPLTCSDGTASTGIVTILGGCAALDEFTIAGVTFTATAGANDFPNGIFQDVATSGSAIASADFARQAITARAADITAALDLLLPAGTGAGTIDVDAPGAAAIALTASKVGLWGDAALTESTATVRITVSGATMTHTAPDPAAVPSEFGSAAYWVGQHATDVSIPVATGIVAAINDAANQVLILAAYAGPPPAALDGTVTAANGGGTLAAVTLTASLPGYSGQLDMSTTEAVELVLSGATLVNVKADPSNFEFDSLINSTAGTNITSANSLVAALNNAASDTALGTTIGGSTVTASNVAGTSNVVTSLADTAGSDGAMAITESTAAARIVVSANAMGKTMVSWTGTLINSCAAAVQALVDAGTAATVTTVNAAMNAVGGVSGISVATGNSSLPEILSILSGREYRVTVPVVKDATGKNWDTTPDGGFTTPNVTWGTGMLGGEWGAITAGSKYLKTSGHDSKPGFAAGGDTVNNEIGGARTTVHGTHFAASVLNGQLSQFAAGVTLFPDPEVQHWVGDYHRRTGRQAPLLNQRVVTVYDDDGTLLV